MYEVWAEMALFTKNNFHFLLNAFVLVMLIIAWVISGRSANIRWLISVIMLIKIIDVSTKNIIMGWGTGYYFMISTFDALEI